MVYEWKMPGLYDIPAQTAGEELDRIYEEKGELQARDVVNESRPKTAPLHPLFEWDDPKAAELYREQQARNIIQCVVTVQETKSKEPVTVRAFVHVAESYRPTRVVLTEKSLSDELVERARQDMEAFRKRLLVFSGLQPVRDLITAIDDADQRLSEEACICKN